MYTPLEVDEYKKRFKEGAEPHVLLDVRTEEEYEEIHIPGAVLIPLDELSDRVAEVTPDLPVVVVCRTGMRSIMGIQILRYAGLQGELFNLEGGTKGWAEHGYPTDSGS